MRFIKSKQSKKSTQSTSSGGEQKAPPPARPPEEKEQEFRLKVQSEVESSGRISREVLKTIIFNVMNLIVVGVLVFLLTRLPQMADNLKKTRSENLLQRETADIAVLKSDIERARARVEDIDAYFANDEELIAFVAEMDTLRATGVVTGFSFLGNEPIDDKSGNKGLPINIVFVGSIEQINSALRQIESLPYFIKAVDIELERNQSEEIGISYEMRYGGLIYVGQNI
ncbi:hypothetical protein A2801_02485 [Candidatus Woesebacteria bacterium RIFCSPHIGHO2_01_FULL_41_10]|uniref:Uncharacterized protein n=1 Tax=Candidatus Woesebacteria bacterium RIFCSPHIGHO2_01_FULL_41_10 TaxID=1802500 RepID=A0A1F7YLT0_9BACT|nr:MAG: hypothetical protein A2801_02485 [Candidatus Woesebacteria bacterium RIFCSPHIGHO2_01_FULL_41_10]